MDVDERIVGVVVDNLRRRHRLDADQAAADPIVALGRLAEIHGQRAGDDHQRLVLLGMAVTATLGGS